ncbi:EF-P 5-aminopentanol modification-associated protein YfmF [Clostridium cylindrosporum]|uniref:Putative inactive metalloprotease YmfF n=1 Tax=Clostridium cylindrosporum DSM 605 TaxID=1121307 RepID=A0A0J8G0T0_CLOCY|nr:pitrilysin family protein [Clostridium cylindrosporum]KMT21396.1 putative inactive metalloprotease YmfF [Clostridium cylindrosporum DSM 605]
MNIIKENLAKNKEVYLIKNKSMKSIIVWFMFYMPLDEKASENALISNILLRGSRKHQSSREISKFLNAAYGSIIGTDINLKGEVYTLGVHLNYINPNLEFVEGDITRDMLKFLEEVIYHPLEENNKFKEEYFQTEKQNLLMQLKGKGDNKESYAFDKTIEVMCEGEAYSIDKLGKISWIESLTNEKCYQRYKEIIKDAPLKVYVMGDIEMDSFTSTLKEIFTFNNAKDLEVNINHKEVEKVKEVFEDVDTNQGKLCMGFRTSIDLNSKEFAALTIVNRLFGGGADSKLFINLREKESLCYTIYSTLEKHKGMMFVACGIDSSVKNIAKEKIIETLNSIKNGDFTDEHLSISIAGMMHSLTSIRDNKYTYIAYLQGLNIYGAKYRLEDLCESLSKVTRDEVIKAANTLTLDTVYFLGRGEKNENEKK